MLASPRPLVTRSLSLTLALCLSAGTAAARSEVAQSEPSYALQPERGTESVRADNPAQGLTAWIGPGGVRVEPGKVPAPTSGQAMRDQAASDSTGSSSWSVAFALQGAGREGALSAVATAGVESDGPRAALYRDAIVEWYENRPEGLEQGFDLSERPAGEPGRVVLELTVDARGLLAVPAEQGTALVFVQPGSRLPTLRYGDLAVRDATGRLLAASLELAGEAGATRLRVTYDDDGAQYPVRIDPLLTTSSWSSDESESTLDVAWGDWDGDGDLDLAIATSGGPNHVYENLGGSLATTAAWTSSESEPSFSVAWGDWDGDGDLDLAVGNFLQPNRVYENTGTTLDTTAAWTSDESESTLDVAWGDWDGDGDLDLAVATSGGPNHVYENLGGSLATSAGWSSSESDDTNSVAWGDWDDDGDLDLAVGNYLQPNRVYENTGTTLNTTAAWSSDESDSTQSVAWGDWDADGDLDLAVANIDQSNRVYENVGSPLATTATWSSDQYDVTRSVAWGDWDGDGDLDLAAGNQGDPIRVYENTGSTLATAAAWSASVSDQTRSVAWGDWDGDGDLDLAEGNYNQPDRVYRNIGGTLDTTAAWSSDESDVTMSVAWGDWDGDGDLDLAVANFGQPNRVYENIGGTLATTAAWSSDESDDTGGVAWGDWDGDGDLDLAAANFGQPNRVYENTGATLDTTAAWSSDESDDSESVAWGDWDGDGDLDLAAGNSGGPSRVYENTGGTLITTAAWSSDDTDGSLSVAWGDWDGDGDLDLAAGKSSKQNLVYRNGSITHPLRLPESAASPVIERRPGGTDTAAGYSSECLASSYPVVGYSLVDEEGDPARRVVLEYAVDGAHWLPATSDPGGEDVLADPAGFPHEVVWDNLADGVVRASLVRLRITVPYQASTRLAAPIQRAALRAVSPPFSLCVPAADLTVTLEDGATSATPGGAVEYTLTVANDGPDDATGVAVSDTFPAALSGVTWSCASGGGGGACGAASGSGDLAENVDLPAGGSVVFTVEATVDPGATGTLSDTASAALPAGLTELAPADDSATDSDLLVPSTDLSITNDDGQTAAKIGGAVAYQIVVANAGPSDASAAQVVDAFPATLTGVAWTCSASGGGVCAASGSGSIAESVDLPVGASVTFTATGTVDVTATGTLATTASVYPTFPTASAGAAALSSSLDPDLGNNTASDVDTLDPCRTGAVVVDGVTFPGTHVLESDTSITTESQVVVGTGADVVLRAPVLAFGSGFHVEAGASFEANSEAVTCSPGG